jgi:hypothetical protein
MALRFYGDESEDKQEKVLAIGGFLGLAEEWDALQEKWIARVKPTGVSAYHMTDCECGQGEFSRENGWCEQDRRDLTIDLIELIAAHNIFLIGHAVLLDDYSQFPPVNDEGVKLGHDKWHMAFQGLLQQAANRVGDDAPPEETIAFFLDWKQKQGAAQFLFDYTKNETRLKPWRQRLGTLTFGHKEFDVPGSLPLLQVADIAAVETRKAIGNPITHPHLPERKSLARLKEAGKVWSISFLDEPVLTAIYEMKREDLGLPNKAKEAAERLHKLRPDGWRYQPEDRSKQK